MTDKPSDLEIAVYVDGQLDAEGRFAVEEYLSHQPDLAAQVMGDLGMRSALQLLARDTRPLPARLTRLAARLDGRADTARSRYRRWMPLGVSALVAGLAALLLVTLQGPPDYVDYALTSHRIAMMRAEMHSQAEMPHYDARDIARNTAISIPSVPEGWQVTDVQLFPTDRGPALLLAVRTQDGDPLSLFALRERTGAPERPDAIREGAQSVAYWRRGEMSYALVGDTEPGAIDATAEALARAWS